MFSFNHQIATIANIATSKISSNPMTEYYRNYLSVAIFMFAAMGMVGAMLGMAKLLRPNVSAKQKYKVYESGSDPIGGLGPVSYTHLRAHETVLDLVCRLLLDKKK